MSILCRVLSQQPTSSARCTDHSSGDDDTGAIPELHKPSSLGDSPMDDGEHSWEATLDKNLPPPEMKRMRRMLSNRESARRSRRASRRTCRSHLQLKTMIVCSCCLREAVSVGIQHDDELYVSVSIHHDNVCMQLLFERCCVSQHTW
jgi:hypothetical protein